MHHFAGADDSVDRTDLNANRASGAYRFVDDGNGIRFFLAISLIQRQFFTPEHSGQFLNSGFSACRTTVDGDSIFSNGQRIGAAAVETALCTLGLRQNGENPVNQSGFVFFRIFHIAIIANFSRNKKAVSFANGFQNDMSCLIESRCFNSQNLVQFRGSRGVLKMDFLFRENEGRGCKSGQCGFVES